MSWHVKTAWQGIISSKDEHFDSLSVWHLLALEAMMICKPSHVRFVRCTFGMRACAHYCRDCTWVEFARSGRNKSEESAFGCWGRGTQMLPWLLILTQTPQLAIWWLSFMLQMENGNQNLQSKVKIRKIRSDGENCGIFYWCCLLTRTGAAQANHWEISVRPYFSNCHLDR